MILYMLRHASAGEPKADPVKDDRRPLDSEGVGQAHDVGRALAALEVQVDAVVSSPLKRAMQTAAVAANELGFDGKIQRHAALHGDASFDQFRQLLRDFSDGDSVLLVGHNPSLSEFLSLLLSGGTRRRSVDLRKGGVAKIEVERNDASLSWCLTPKVVRALYRTAAVKSRPKTERK